VELRNSSRGVGMFEVWIFVFTWYEVSSFRVDRVEVNWCSESLN
jgi:hypothetical protein